jgi:hypothetical protein
MLIELNKNQEITLPKGQVLKEAHIQENIGPWQREAFFPGTYKLVLLKQYRLFCC